MRVIITTLDIKLTGGAKSDPYFSDLLAHFLIEEGQPLDHGKYEAAKKSLSLLAQRRGYFDASFTKSSVDLFSKTNSATVSLWFDSGPMYKFGKLHFMQDLPVDSFIRDIVKFKQGDYFLSSKLSDFNNAINETGYFSAATVLPDFENKEGLEIPLNIFLTMRPDNSVNVGLGFSTDEGVRGKLRWLHPWVNKYGHSVEGNLIASIPRQEASIIYKIPLEDPLYNYFSLDTGYKMRDQNDTDTKQYIVGFNRHWQLSNTWLRTAYIRYDNEAGKQGQQTFSTELILPGISFTKLRTKGGSNVTWGDRQSVFFEIANKAWFSSENVIKVYGKTKWLRTYDGHQFVASAEAGAIQTSSIYNVPASMRFFAGGDQSIRGFDYESIAPKNNQDYLVGGLYLAVSSFEYRFPVSQNWKIAFFGDVGTATDDFSEPLSMGAGSGAVWASPIGPVRIYLGIPLTESENNFTVHFMIGPEL
jgi:translocation and assembly module TamA